MGEPSNRLLFGFHSIIDVSGPPIWNLFDLYSEDFGRAQEPQTPNDGAKD